MARRIGTRKTAAREKRKVHRGQTSPAVFSFYFASSRDLIHNGKSIS